MELCIVCGWLLLEMTSKGSEGREELKQVLFGRSVDGLQTAAGCYRDAWRRRVSRQNIGPLLGIFLRIA